MASGRTIPVVLDFSADENTALVSFKTIKRQVRATFVPDCGHGPRLHVYGFASQFGNKNKSWSTVVTFYRKDGAWRYEDLKVLEWHKQINGDPPQIVGFIDDVSPNDLGIGHSSGRQVLIGLREISRTLKEAERTVKEAQRLNLSTVLDEAFEEANRKN